MSLAFNDLELFFISLFLCVCLGKGSRVLPNKMLPCFSPHYCISCSSLCSCTFMTLSLPQTKSVLCCGRHWHTPEPQGLPAVLLLELLSPTASLPITHCMALLDLVGYTFRFAIPLFVSEIKEMVLCMNGHHKPYMPKYLLVTLSYSSPPGMQFLFIQLISSWVRDA